MPCDAEDGVAEAGLEVGQVHGVHVLVQDQLTWWKKLLLTVKYFSASHLTEVLEDHVDVGVALGVGEEGPGLGDRLGVILQLDREAVGGAEKGRDQEDGDKHRDGGGGGDGSGLTEALLSGKCTSEALLITTTTIFCLHFYLQFSN